MTKTQTESRTSQWFTVKVQNNREKSVSERLKSDMRRDYNEEINILIPTHNTLKLKDGKRVEKTNLLYPGYIFVETVSVDKLNHLVKATTGATNILKDPKGKPIPLRQAEIDRMIGTKETSAKITDLYNIGEMVVILEGPFTNFKGVIDHIDSKTEKVKVEVMLFGRKNTVELNIIDISKTNE